MTPREILEKAADIIEGSRHETHGDYTESHRKIALIWSIMVGKSISPTLLCDMMVVMKIIRDIEGSTPDPDHALDKCGWAALGGAHAHKPPKKD